MSIESDEAIRELIGLSTKFECVFVYVNTLKMKKLKEGRIKRGMRMKMMTITSQMTMMSTLRDFGQRRGDVFSSDVDDENLDEAKERKRN